MPSLLRRGRRATAWTVSIQGKTQAPCGGSGQTMDGSHPVRSNLPELYAMARFSRSRGRRRRAAGARSAPEREGCGNSRGPEPILPLIQSSQPSPASPRSLRSLLLFFVVVGTAIASGCGDGLLDLAVPEGEALVRIISGEGQEGEVGSYLPEPVVVEVLSAGGAPQSGVPVEWSFVDGFGSTSNQGGEAEALETVVSYTDGRGRASASWLLGSEAGAQLGTVGLLDLEPPVAHSGGEAPSKMRVRLTAFAHAAPPAALEVTPEEGVLHPG